VDREGDVVGLARDELDPGLGELRPDDSDERPDDQEEAERRDAVHDAVRPRSIVSLVPPLGNLDTGYNVPPTLLRQGPDGDGPIVR
jgi:hypothetical protein